MRKLLLGLVVLAGCTTSDAAPKGKHKGKPVPPNPVVQISSVNLADDCPPLTTPATPAAPAAPATPAAPAKAAKVAPSTPTAPATRVPAGAVPQTPGVVAQRATCDQTSMQLSLTGSSAIEASKVKVKKVELLDEKGKVLQRLTPRNPQRFDANAYVAWDEQVARGTTVNVMYALSAPDWNTLTNGRWNAHDKSFQLRVTINVGPSTSKVTKAVVAPARLQPPVPT